MAAVVRVYPGGTSAGFAGPGPTTPAVRGEVKGWTAASARRLIAWLWSVDSTCLPAGGWALTLTTGGRPETADDWHDARRALMKRLGRAGIGMQQWVVEWTENGRPHLHMAVYPTSDTAKRVEIVALVAWLAICDARGWPVETAGQHIVPIHDVGGWLQYVSKHASRGVEHYQRQGIPPGWEKSGRLWGSWGDWPTAEPGEMRVTPEVFWRYRQLHAQWQAARLVESGHPEAAARLLARLESPAAREKPGVSGWIPAEEAVKLLKEALQSSGSDEGREIGGMSWQ